jgi:putative membrane protein
MALRQIAWNYALSRNLRGQKTTQGLEKMLDHTELEAVTQRSNVPLALLFLQGRAIKYAFNAQWINSYQMTELDRTLTRLTDSMGKCERIKSTVFPSSYSYMIDILIYLFILFLPFGLVDMIGIIIIPTTLSIAFAFLTIERIAIYMQDPFENRMNDTPMTSISTTIEINIREELNLGDVPKPLQPVKGVLM